MTSLRTEGSMAMASESFEEEMYESESASFETSSSCSASTFPEAK